MSDSDDPDKKITPKQIPSARRGRTPHRGVSVDDRDRRKTDSAGGLVSTGSQHHGHGTHARVSESWEDMHTPPLTDAELWRTIRQVGIDLEKFAVEMRSVNRELSDDFDEMRIATMQLLTKVLDKVLEDKRLVVTSEVKVREAGAMANIHSQSEDQSLRRRIAWKWIGVVLAVAFSSLVTALITKYL